MNLNNFYDSIKESVDEFLDMLSYEGSEHSTISRDSIKLVKDSDGYTLCVKYLCNRNNFRNAPYEMHIKLFEEKMQNDIAESTKVKNENKGDSKIVSFNTIKFLLHLYPYVEGESCVKEYIWRWNDKTNNFEQ